DGNGNKDRVAFSRAVLGKEPLTFSARRQPSAATRLFAFARRILASVVDTSPRARANSHRLGRRAGCGATRPARRRVRLQAGARLSRPPVWTRSRPAGESAHSLVYARLAGRSLRSRRVQLRPSWRPGRRAIAGRAG